VRATLDLLPRTTFHLPSLPDAMEEGTILTWLRVRGPGWAGDELVEIETGNATKTYESPMKAILEIVAEKGSALSVGTVIARLTPASAEDATGERGAASDSPPGSHQAPRGAPVPDLPAL
jgi:pyruvate/2-oxoglutarate dehydrogenase complex dihydrolipoamide acyltransferase (E2) component